MIDEEDRIDHSLDEQFAKIMADWARVQGFYDPNVVTLLQDET